MQHRHLCPKCGHNHILLIARVADGLYSAAKVMNLAIVPFGDAVTTHGPLSAATCRRCGFTELYVAHPETIPVDGTYVREVVGPEPTAPYR